MNSYAAYHVMYGGVDPWGLDYIYPEGLGPTRGKYTETVEFSENDEINNNNNKTEQSGSCPTENTSHDNNTDVTTQKSDSLLKSAYELLFDDDTSGSLGVGLSGTGALSPFGLNLGLQVGVNTYGQVYVSVSESTMLSAGGYFGGGVTGNAGLNTDGPLAPASLYMGVHAEANVGLGVSAGGSLDIPSDTIGFEYTEENGLSTMSGDDGIGGISGAGSGGKLGVGSGAMVGVGPSVTCTVATDPIPGLEDQSLGDFVVNAFVFFAQNEILKYQAKPIGAYVP